MTIATRQDLADFCLRQLGGGVVNVEISADQIEDNINEAIKYYQEFHYDGLMHDFIARKITATTFTVADATGFSVGDTLTVAAKDISTSIRGISSNTITVNEIDGFSGVVLAAADSISNGTVTKTILTVTLGDIDRRYIAIDDYVFGVNRIMNLSGILNTGELLFNIQYQMMASEIQRITSGNSNYYYSVLNYLDHLNFILRKEKSFRFNRRTNKLFLDLNWGTELKIDDIVVADVYRAIDETTYPKMLNDRWLLEYTTALFKKQVGTNLKKYTGMTLPGGLQYNGQQMYDEAVREIENLRQEALQTGAPLEFLVG